MGNRGILHEGHEIVRSSRNRAWLTCTLSFKNQKLPQWEPGHYTQLFFLDEAVALAAGHRPCAECRRGAYNDFRTAWVEGRSSLMAEDEPGRPSAKELDQQLHRERRDPVSRKQQVHEQNWADLPDGGFVLLEAGPAVVVGDHLTGWTAGNRYGERFRRPGLGRAIVLTPPSSLRALQAGYPVQLDSAAL
jgi:hypothetical protein